MPPSERYSLLKLLAHDEVAQRLIATWPNVDHSGKREAIIERWSALANVRPLEIHKKWPLLFNNGFLTKDGGVDAVADRYVQSVAVAALPAAARPRRAIEKSPTTPTEGEP